MLVLAVGLEVGGGEGLFGEGDDEELPWQGAVGEAGLYRVEGAGGRVVSNVSDVSIEIVWKGCAGVDRY